MKWRSIQDRLEKRLEKKKEWHLWFAWYPIRIPGITHDTTYWFCRIKRYRQQYQYGDYWVYGFEGEIE